jgi:hypothetical protein
MLSELHFKKREEKRREERRETKKIEAMHETRMHT